MRNIDIRCPMLKKSIFCSSPQATYILYPVYNSPTDRQLSSQSIFFSFIFCTLFFLGGGGGYWCNFSLEVHYSIARRTSKKLSSSLQLSEETRSPPSPPGFPPENRTGTYLCWNFITIYRDYEPSRNRVVVLTARLHRLAEAIPWNRFLGSFKVLKMPSLAVVSLISLSAHGRITEANNLKMFWLQETVENTQSPYFKCSWSPGIDSKE